MADLPPPAHRHSEWHDLAREKIESEIKKSHALLLTEAVARLSPEAGPYWSSKQAIEPHIVNQTVDEMLHDGTLSKTYETSRGRRPIEVLVPKNQKGIQTAVTRAAATKRSLYSTYESWAIGNASRPHGRLGPAGEQIADASIRATNLVLPLPPENRRNYRGHTLDGPVDWIGVTHDDTHTTAGVVLVEVKNIRQWIYPQHIEVFQLLSKAASLQLALPELNLVPILICRRANRRIFAMSKHLGFYTIAMAKQPVGKLNEDEHQRMLQVRQGLGFLDLTDTTDPLKSVQDRVSGMHPYWPAAAEKWKLTCSSDDAVNLIRLLADKRTNAFDRVESRRALGAVLDHVSPDSDMMWWRT